jgi:hypothetical protein
MALEAGFEFERTPQISIDKGWVGMDRSVDYVEVTIMA